MNPLRLIFHMASLMLLAMPALAIDTFQITITRNSPASIPTGLIMKEGGHILVQAEGAIRNLSGLPFTNGWLDPSGLGRIERSGQLVSNCPYGILLGEYGSNLSSGFPLGEFAMVRPPAQYEGQEFYIGLNMSPEDLSGIDGAFIVHLTHYTDEEAIDYTYTLDANSPRPKGTGLFAETEDQFMVIGQGAARVITFTPVNRGWFDAAGFGVLSRTGQIFSDSPYGCLLGTFTDSLSTGFYIGDAASWTPQPEDIGHELMLGLNMDDDDQAGMSGQIVAHVLKISIDSLSVANDENLPAIKAIAAVDNYPNPFNPSTTLRFELTRPKDVRVSIVNVAGKVMRTLASRRYPAGTHSLTWDGRDEGGRILASGTYFLRLDTDEGMRSHKLTLIK